MVKIYSNELARDWDDYIIKNPQSSIFHLSAWKTVIEKSFGHNCTYFYYLDSEEITGVLPLVWIKSSLFGSFLVSLPFLNYGGILADDYRIANQLNENAIELAKKYKVEFLELRHKELKYLDLINKQHKVAMLLELPGDSNTLWESLKAKVRNQIRKAERNNLVIEFGGLEKLNDFYSVFSKNMRDLGTPVYSKKFFKNILINFDEAKLCTAYYMERPIASGFIIGFKGKLDIPWASSLRDYNNLCGNMFMYWNILKYACESGYSIFDFGRCTPEESTYHFKKQWGAQPVQLNWQYWLANGRPLPEINPDNPKYQSAIKIWQKLPVGVTKLIGPPIVKYIP